MKKVTALLLLLAILVSCVPAMAVEQKYTSPVLGTSFVLPDYLYVLVELPAKDGNGPVIYFTMLDDETQIISTMKYVPEFLGLQTRDVPKEEIEGWKEFFTDKYPKHSKSMLIKPKYNSSQRIYRFYGMNEEGKWMLNYTGVKDGLYVSVCCEAGRFGYKSAIMRAIFEVFNGSFQMFAASRGIDFVRFDPDDYEVEIFDLLYDDSPSSIFRKY